MILHVAWLDKFIPPFIALLGEHFDIARHRFWLNGDRDRYPYPSSPVTYQVRPGVGGRLRGYLRLAIDMHRAEKVVLHGLFDPRIVLLLGVMPWLLRKCYWIIWGGDLYARQMEAPDWKWRISEVFRSVVIRRIGHLVTYVEGDVRHAREWYGATGRFHECLVYTSNVYCAPPARKGSAATTVIQVGNSASPSNNHIEALRKLLPYRNDDILIYVPLSYGDPEHAARVIRQGVEWFGDKFRPLTTFMPFEEYLDLLGQIDIAVFNHRRQQAMGNIITLLGLGKKVYLRSDVTSWATLRSKNITVYDVEQFDLSPLDPGVRQDNQEAIRANFSRERLLAQLRDLFDA